MSNVCLIHGWGFAPDFWCNISVDNALAVDLGFYGAASNKLPETPTIYITHSMGLMWLLRQRKANIKGLIILNGFTKFTASDDFKEGVSPRVLNRMLRQFNKAPVTVWSEFMKNCGISEPEMSAEADVLAMENGLKHLGEWDIRKEYEELDVPKLIIASKRDMIVPEMMSTACFGDEVIWDENADHLLPLSNPSFIQEHIQEFLSQFP